MRFKGLLLFLIFASFLALTAAYVAELIFKLPPCRLCYYQRGIFLFIAFLSIFFFFRRYYFVKLAIILLLLIASAALAFYHMGVEKNWFKYSSECTTDFAIAKSFEEYRMMLKQKDIVSCDQVMFEFLGLSIAGWNFIYSSFLLFFTIILGIRTNWFREDEIEA